MKLINQYNFLRWHIDEVFIPTVYDPAKGYERDTARCDYMPLLINGEPLNFYINTVDGLDGIVQEEVTSDVSILSQTHPTPNVLIIIFGGTPVAGTSIEAFFSIDGNPEQGNTNTATAGQSLADLVAQIVTGLAFLESEGATAEVYNSTGIKITAPVSAELTTINITQATFGSPIKLKLVNAQTGQVVNADIATLIQDTFVTQEGENVFTYYASVSPSFIPPGVYIFRIGNNTENFLDSNPVLVPADDYSKYSCLCRFRHDRYYYGVNYQNLTDFYQQFRLHLNEIDGQYEQNKDVYNEVTTGKQRTYNNFKKKVLTLETYYFDKDAHDAAEIMFDSEKLIINGKIYTPKATYKIAPRSVMSKLNKGVVDLYDQGFATANRCLVPIEAATEECVGIEFPAYDLPDGVIGSPYSYSFVLTGAQPFQITDVTKPAWMNIGILGNEVSFTGTPDAEETVNVSFTVSNCSDNNSENFADSFDVVTDNTYDIVYTNNIAINVRVLYGDNNSAPSTELVDGTYPGGSGFTGTSVDLPLTNANVVLDLSGTDKHIISANLNGVGGSFISGISTSATWTGVNGGIHMSFITD